MHSHFGEWNSIYRQFRRWTAAGVWDVMLEALNEAGAGHGSVQMIDSTLIRAHQHAAGALKSEIRTGVLAARAAGSRPRSISAATLLASLSRSRLATRYDKAADSFLGFVLVAAIRLWIRHFVHPA
ncbi:MAG TPA: hypothetical protein DCG66_00580 [Brevundimonas sp.]|nr:hypothetical protein [Brevundimonas sp.]HAF79491.1 hypothetical protein [Brevundimonas sp.]